MSVGEGAESAPWISRAAVASALALALLAVAGWVLWLLAPAAPSAADRVRLAAELLVAFPNQLRPEPGEHFVYVTLILLSPFAIGVAAWTAMRFRPAGRGRADAPLALLVIVAAWLMVGLDPVSRHFRLAPWIFLLVCAVAAALATGDVLLERQRWAKPLAVGVAVLVSAWIVVTESWRSASLMHMPQMHFEAFAYSIVASTRGRTCLVNLHAQYGCYGMVLGPVFRRIGATVSHITAAAAVLSVVSVTAIGGFCWRTMRSPLLAAGAALALAVMTIHWGRDIYLQYLPLRILFPALSLPAILWWEARPSATRAAWLGLAAACALFWNLDSGAPVAGALGLYILASGGLADAAPRRRIVFGLAYGSALAIMGAALLGALALKGGAWPDLRAALDYQRIFVGSGFYMLPMPPPPAAWTVCVVLAALALAGYALKLAQRTPSPGADRAAFVAILGVGLFSYYVGRSHIEVLAAASWPFVILAFLLLDAVRTDSRAASGILRSGGALMVAMLVATAVGNAPSLAPSPLQPGVDAIAEDVAFVRDHTPPSAPLALLASEQAMILAELGRAPALPGPGWAETLTKTDADAVFDFLVARGPRDVFASSDLVYTPWMLTDLSPWIALRLPRLNAVYDVADRGPGDRLIHFVRKPTSPIAMAGAVRSR